MRKYIHLQVFCSCCFYQDLCKHYALSRSMQALHKMCVLANQVDEVLFNKMLVSANQAEKIYT